jgi:hypothetical protein
VTKAVLNEMHRRIQGLQEQLGTSAGIDPLNDRFLVGAIGAYRDVTNVEFDEVTDGN